MAGGAILSDIEAVAARDEIVSSWKEEEKRAKAAWWWKGPLTVIGFFVFSIIGAWILMYLRIIPGSIIIPRWYIPFGIIISILLAVYNYRKEVSSDRK